MKATKVLSLILIISLMICNTAYATSFSSEESDGDITEYIILDEQVNEIREGLDNPNNGISLYSDDFTACSFEITCYTDRLNIFFSTGYTRTADQIGIYNFKLQKKVWYGWKTMFSRSEVYNTNASFCSRGYDLDAEHGETYRLKGTHFVIINGSTKKLSATSGEIKYK